MLRRCFVATSYLGLWIALLSTLVGGTNAAINVSFVADCLNVRGDATGAPTLEYPSDAEDHYRQIHVALRPWAQTAAHVPHSAAGYSGDTPPLLPNCPRAATAFTRSAACRCHGLNLYVPILPILAPRVH